MKIAPPQKPVVVDPSAPLNPAEKNKISFEQVFNEMREDLKLMNSSPIFNSIKDREARNLIETQMKVSAMNLRVEVYSRCAEAASSTIKRLQSG